MRVYLIECYGHSHYLLDLRNPLALLGIDPLRATILALVIGIGAGVDILLVLL